MPGTLSPLAYLTGSRTSSTTKYITLLKCRNIDFLAFILRGEKKRRQDETRDGVLGGDGRGRVHTGRARGAGRPESQPPPLRASHVRLCALPTWYRIPALKRRSVRSIVVPAAAFLGYLRTDGIVLPRVPDGNARQQRPQV